MRESITFIIPITAVLVAVTAVITRVRVRRQLHREASPSATNEYGSQRMTGKPCLADVYKQKALTDVAAKVLVEAAAQGLPVSSIVTDGADLRVHVVVENPTEVLAWHLPMVMAFGNEGVQVYQRSGDDATVILGGAGRWDVCVSPRTTEA